MYKDTILPPLPAPESKCNTEYTTTTSVPYHCTSYIAQELKCNTETCTKSCFLSIHVCTYRTNANAALSIMVLRQFRIFFCRCLYAVDERTCDIKYIHTTTASVSYRYIYSYTLYTDANETLILLPSQFCIHTYWYTTNKCKCDIEYAVSTSVSPLYTLLNTIGIGKRKGYHYY